MGVYNTLLDVPVACPACGKPTRQAVQFKIGPCQLYDYRLGDRLDWRREGYVHAPEAQGKARYEQEVLVQACSPCVSSYVWRYKEIRRWLEKQGRWINWQVPLDEDVAHPEPNQQDGVALVDGIYEGYAWIRRELELLGAPVSFSLEMWPAKLVIIQDTLAEGGPAQPRERRRLDMSLISKMLEGYRQYGARVSGSQLDDARIGISLELETAESVEPTLVDWLEWNLCELGSLPALSLAGARLVAANLNAGVVLEARKPGGVLPALLKIRSELPFVAELLKLCPRIVEARASSGKDVRFVLDLKAQGESGRTAEKVTLSFQVIPTVRTLERLERLPEPPPGIQASDPRAAGLPFKVPPD